MFGENLKTLRKNKGITQEELAARLNVVRQTISKWEKGQSVPDAQTDALAEQLARINEQLVIKNLRSKRVWKTIGIIAACAIIANFLLVGLMLLFSYTAYESYGTTVVTQAPEQIIE